MPIVFDKKLLGSLLLSAALPLMACNPGGGGGGGDDDQDNDGFTVNDGDCADLDPSRNPGAAEVCNGIDDDCNLRVDEPFDVDQDGASSCNGGDCNDQDPTVFPGATEVTDGLDNNCDGVIDNTVNSNDQDNDGFSINDGDCDDTQAAVSPSAIEVLGDGVDNNCNGAADEPPTPCDGGALNPVDPFSFAKAMGFCNGEVISAEFVGPSNPSARAIVGNFGNANVAFEGSKMVHFSSGAANTASHDSGTDLFNTSQHPAPVANPPTACGQADPTTVNDYTEYKLTIQVPSNAQSFSYKFQFFSSEYPTFRCSQFDDTFLAILDSQAFQGNISFDANGSVVSVNNGFFQICFDDLANVTPNDCTTDPNAPLAGTGYVPNGDPLGFSSGAGATLPLNTTSPVVPGETMTLRFIIFDEGDGILDSSVFIDAFTWNADPADGGPITIP